MRKNLQNRLKQIRKQKSDYSYDGLIEETRKSFFSHLEFLPEEMLYDIFSYFLEHNTFGQDTYSDFDRLSLKLLDASDLFTGSYDASISSITEEDMGYIKDSVNDFAMDLDDEVLFYVMQKAVEKGSFH